jgi:hypothetical protein
VTTLSSKNWEPKVLFLEAFYWVDPKVFIFKITII